MIKIKKYYTLYLIILTNITIYFLMSISSNSFILINNHTLIDWGALIYQSKKLDDLWRIITYQFLHTDISHLIINMFILYIVGISLLQYINNILFVFIYLTTGLTSSICCIFFSTHLISVGASGSILGVFGFYYILLNKIQNNGGKHEGIDKKLLIINLFICVLLIFGYLIDSTNNALHIGGLVSGIIIGLITNKTLDNS